MLNITKELKAKLLAAKSEEEAAALVKANGQEITAEVSMRISTDASIADVSQVKHIMTGHPRQSNK
jgi:hypothetical protein